MSYWEERTTEYSNIEIKCGSRGVKRKKWEGTSYYRKEVDGTFVTTITRHSQKGKNQKKRVHRTKKPLDVDLHRLNFSDRFYEGQRHVCDPLHVEDTLKEYRYQLIDKYSHYEVEMVTLIAKIFSYKTNFINSVDADIFQQEFRILFFVELDTHNAVGIVKIGVKNMDIPEYDLFSSAFEEAYNRVMGRIGSLSGWKGHILLDNETCGAIVHELSHVAELDPYDPLSFDRSCTMRKSLQDCDIRIWDDPGYREQQKRYQFGGYFLDEEGNKGQKIDLSHAAPTDCMSAAVFPCEPNGHGRSDFRTPPGARTSVTYLQKGSCTVDELMEQYDETLYLLGAESARITANGFIILSPFGSYILKKGEATRATGAHTIIIHWREFVSSIEAASNTITFYPSLCKNGASIIDVSMGGPHVLLNKIFCTHRNALVLEEQND